MMRHFAKLFGLLAVSIFIVGCASQRTVQADSEIKIVGVISIMADELPVDYIGISFFNNESKVYDSNVKFNQRAIAAVEARLKKLRPSWIVKPVEGVDIKALYEKSLKKSMFDPTATGGISDDLKMLMERNQFDALFVVNEEIDASLPSGAHQRGVVFILRRIPLIPLKVWASAQINLAMLDKSGSEIVRKIGGASLAVNPNIFDTELNFVSSPTAMSQVLGSAYITLDFAIDDALVRSGY